MDPRIFLFFFGLMCLSSVETHQGNCCRENRICQGLCCKKKWLIVPDIFFGKLTANRHWVNKSDSTDKGHKLDNLLIVFLKNGSDPAQRFLHQTETALRCWPRIENRTDGTVILYLSWWHEKRDVELKVLTGKCTSRELWENRPSILDNPSGKCHSSFKAEECRGSVYNENLCKGTVLPNLIRYSINITTSETMTCVNCKNPVQGPEEKVDITDKLPFPPNKTDEIPPSQAANVMAKMSDLVSSTNASSMELSAGGEVLGVLVREPDPQEVEEVSFGYKSLDSSINIVENSMLNAFQRSITVPKEAFEQAVKMNVTVPFAAVMRFNNLVTEEMEDKVLGNEVIAIEMGALICNLTDYVSINFQNAEYKGIPSCQSWNGEGEQINWTDAGCDTITNGSKITCRCSHMTFFAILLTPLNETISSYDLNTLTTITQVGCGVSMFFLCVVFFMHFFLRKAKPSNSTRILIHLVSAMFMLNFSFLVNSHVARLKSHVGCQILAAVMHYFLLATFGWFAVQAFHLCLQLYMGGKIAISRYMLKISITSWALPSVAVIILLIVGKYGENLIHTSDSEESVAMCWITDSNAHFVINIGYYALVFLFTFTTFIIMLSWLVCHKRMNTANTQINSSGKTIGVVLGLCCLLGITWGFAFFAYGVFRIPSYYIFTILNSFQGFFLFIYYYKTSQSGETNSSKTDTASSATTLKTGLDYFENPYGNHPGKK